MPLAQADVRRGLRNAQADASPACSTAPLVDNCVFVPVPKGLQGTAGDAHEGNEPLQPDRRRQAHHLLP